MHPLRAAGLRRAATTAALCAAAGALAADLAVMPTRLQFDAATSRAVLQLHNAGREAVTVQADVLRWERVDGQDRHAPSDALLVSPPVFRVAPGQTQVLRLGLRGSLPEDVEQAFRLQLRELPVSAAADTAPSGLRVLLALRVPVHVAPRAIRRAAQWRPVEGRDDAVWLHNAGNVHLRVQDLRLRDAAGAAQADAVIGAVLLPGEARAVALPAGASAARGATVELLTDRGSVRADRSPPLR